MKRIWFFLPLLLASFGCAGHQPDPVQYSYQHPPDVPYDNPECDPKLAKHRKYIELGRDEERTKMLNEGWDKIAKNGNGTTGQKTGQVQWRTNYVPKYKSPDGVEYGGQYQAIPVASP